MRASEAGGVSEAVASRPLSQEPAAASVARARIGAGLILLMGLWFGLATGLIELVVMAVRKFALDQTINRSPHVVWMAPLFYLAFFLGPAIAAALAARVFSRRDVLRPAVFLFAFIAVASLLILLAYNKLHNAALLVLAIGAGVQVARSAGSNPGRFARLVRRSLPWMAGLVLAMGIFVAGWSALAERMRWRALPAARAGAQNVLLIILDTVRSANLGLYGYARPTSPELDRFAARGVVFDNAISTSPWTLPSHGSMFTGEQPRALSADWLVPLDRRQRTLAEAFRDGGYRTAGFVANFNYATYETGLNRGFLRYDDYPITPGQVVMHAGLGRFLSGRWKLRELLGSDQVLGRKHAERVNREFLSWQERVGERPFFAFLNYYDAHDPYLPPDEFFRKITGRDRPHRLSPFRRIPVPERRKGVPAEGLRLEMDSYDASIAYLDHHLGRLFRELESRGVLDNTVVIITSDHGEEFGEHQIFYHGHTLYRPALHVPLIVVKPGQVPAAVRVPEPTSLVDLAATIQDLAGLQGERFPGRSLASRWSAGGSPNGAALSEVRKGVRLPEWYPVASGDMSSIVLDGMHYIRNADGREELYDWARDPGERRNLAASAGLRLDAFRAALRSMQGEKVE